MAVLDASAVLALLFDEPGAEKAALHLPGGLLSSVNLAEVATDLARRGLHEDVARDHITDLQLQIVAFDREDGFNAGAIWPITRASGLSLGDRACLALGRRLRLPVVTTDRAWARLDLGVKVIAIR
ncbi:MAG: type II toxin-antitoxin system VapC family toxin [Alphaproteobacteria bacterium]|nr:type II toxin-antitoxin system VapC family toxin [Alphaproteobacteria bacterium]